MAGAITGVQEVSSPSVRAYQNKIAYARVMAAHFTDPFQSELRKQGVTPITERVQPTPAAEYARFPRDHYEQTANQQRDRRKRIQRVQRLRRVLNALDQENIEGMLTSLPTRVRDESGQYIELYAVKFRIPVEEERPVKKQRVNKYPETDGMLDVLL
ncbi:MAG: hypothetical protein V1740_01425 [Candidatus Woesearchaeota archaeon]